jgi:site-specific recombinase XerD
MGDSQIAAFLTHLASERHVSPSTQNQALAALVFLYQEVLHLQVSDLPSHRVRHWRRIPIVLSPEEVRLLLDAVDRLATEQPYGLMARLMYGSGLRLLECCRLRVQDVDLVRLLITVRQDEETTRIVMLPRTLRERLGYSDFSSSVTAASPPGQVFFWRERTG